MNYLLALAIACGAALSVPAPVGTGLPAVPPPPGTYNWSPVGGGTNGPVTVLLNEAAPMLWLAGSFTQAGSLTTQHVAGYTDEYFPFGNGLSGTVTCGVLFGEELYLGGSGLGGNSDLAHWDGNQWTYSTVFQGNLPQITALHVHQGQLYAAGVSYGFGGTDHFVQALSGGNWQQVGNKFDNTVKTLGSFGTRLVAGGDFTGTIGPGGVGAAHVAVLEDAGWEQLGDGLDGYVNVLTEGTDGALCAGGAMYQDGTARFGLALLYPGNATWAHMLPDLAEYITPSTAPVEVRALLAMNPGFIVGGAFHYHQGTTEGQGLAAFTGVPNTLVPMASFNGPVNAIALDHGIVDAFALFAAGDFTQQESEAVPYIAHFFSAPLGMAGPNTTLGMELHPNPAGHQIQVAWQGATTGHGQIDILDSRGRAVHSQATKGQRATVDLSALAPGTYYVQLTINGHGQVRPFIKR